MKTLVKIGYIIFSLIFILYLLIPTYSFPEQIDKSLQSDEPADVETPLRRSYFTDYDRGQVMSYYQNQYERGLFNIFSLTYRLNYPPEEAQTIIRDQTRSTFLEEIVHPFRESVFVNGFEPKENKDKIVVKGKDWRMKITLKLVQSSVWLRLIGGILVIILMYVLAIAWAQATKDMIVSAKKIWNSR